MKVNTLPVGLTECNSAFFRLIPEYSRKIPLSPEYFLYKIFFKKNFEIKLGCKIQIHSIMGNKKFIRVSAVILFSLLLWVNIRVDFFSPVKIDLGETIFATEPVYGNGYAGNCYRCETSWPPNFALVYCWESPNSFCINTNCMYMAGGCWY